MESSLMFTFLIHDHRKDTVVAASSDAQQAVDRMTSSYSSSSATSERRKRSVELVDENGRTYINGTVEDTIRMLYAFDANCDGFIDVTEWAKLAPLDHFIDLLNVSDVNGKCLFKPKQPQTSHTLLQPFKTINRINLLFQCMHKFK